MATRNVKKSLITMQDILQGQGSTTQTRAGTSKNVDKVDLPFTVSNFTDMQDLDVTVYSRARVYIDTEIYQDFIYDDSATQGEYSSNTGAGYWLSNNSVTQYRGTVSALYDFDVHGGLVGNILLTANLPNNAVITRSWYEVLVPFTSGGSATVALGVRVDDTTGIKGSTAYNDASYNTGFHDAIQDGTAANFTNKTTAKQELILQIGTANLTAGKLRLWADYLLSE